MTKPVSGNKSGDDLRLVPFIVAMGICFSLAVILGTGSWLAFDFVRGHLRRTASESTDSTDRREISVVEPLETGTPSVTIANQSTGETSNTAMPSATVAPPTAPVFENTVAVKGNEIVLGGGATKRPLQRVIVAGFTIAETEVTNAQYAEFIKDTNHAAPSGWNKNQFPKGTENFPVVNVSWRDAKDFCDWMAKKTGAKVRLPHESEWELAARGSQGLKYPWGAEWNKDGAASKETGGKVAAVKSFPLNRSPFGAYDMVGNVWEWTEDKVSAAENVSDNTVKEALKGSSVLRVVKGSAAIEPAKEISAESRYEIPENTKAHVIGFRYVVEQ